MLAEEERALADLRTQLTERERKWHETAAEHASTVATAQVPTQIHTHRNSVQARVCMSTSALVDFLSADPQYGRRCDENAQVGMKSGQQLEEHGQEVF